MESLAFDIIKNLVKYLDANQGGIFIVNDDDSSDVYLELKGCYAYDRKKYREMRIEPGEGLVGTCYIESKTIYLTQIPHSYLSITSGLGEKNPGAIIIVPLVLNDVVFGIVEIASFHEFQPFQISFVEKIGESVASTISSVKTSIRTNQLLIKSQQQAEELKSQEEEMRQNMEELHATQEEMARKSDESIGLLRAIDASSYMIEYDLDGKITNISDSYLNLLKITREQAIGTHHADKIDFSAEQQLNYDRFWLELTKGFSKTQEVKIIVNNSILWLSETYSPIKNRKGKVVKILKIAHNITDYKVA
jgi:methyl-accepting chemotaxis protein